MLAPVVGVYRRYKPVENSGCIIVAQLLPNSGCLPNNEATHPTRNLLIPNNSVWNREFLLKPF